MIFEYILKKHGITPNVDTEVLTNVQFDVMAGAFESGVADYVNLFEPIASEAQAAGAGYVLASLGEASGSLPYTVYMANPIFIRENQETMEKFLNAISKAQQWVATHSAEEIAEVISPSFTGSDLSIITSALQRYKDIDAWKITPQLDETSFGTFQKIMIDAGVLDEAILYDSIVERQQK